MSVADIVRIERDRIDTPRFNGEVNICPGEVLHMADGSAWFHGYGGQKPVRVDPVTHLRLH